MLIVYSLLKHAFIQNMKPLFFEHKHILYMFVQMESMCYKLE